VDVARRVLRRAAPALAASAGLALAALPMALNWSAVTRRAEPEASLPRLSALALLRSAPPDAVLFVYGDNDTYPVWYLQQAEGVRRDVTVVTIPLLPADWYRAELARRHRLGTGDVGWQGLRRTLESLARSARDANRPIAVAVGVTADERRGLGAAWRLTGVLFESVPAGGGVTIDTTRARELAGWLSANRREGHPRGGTDPTAGIIWRLLRCPAWASGADSGSRRAAADSLDSTCNLR
jgi:hypothetical protein